MIRNLFSLLYYTFPSGGQEVQTNSSRSNKKYWLVKMSLPVSISLHPWYPSSIWVRMVRALQFPYWRKLLRLSKMTTIKKYEICVFFFCWDSFRKLPAAIIIYGSMTNDFKEGGSESAFTTPGCKSNSCNTTLQYIN